MNVEDFLPEYPNLSTLPPPEFNKQIYERKEFNELQLTSDIEPRPEKQGDSLQHQKIIRRILSSFTLYDELILNHGMGSGKTCSAIGVIEGILQEDSTINKAIVITVNSSLVRNFKQQLLDVCTPEDRFVINEDDIDETMSPEARIDLKRKRRTNLLKANYSFYTYYEFYQEIRRMTDEQQTAKFSNSVFILDEIHHISFSKWYNAFWNFLHNINNRKIMLMSGTLMKNYTFELGLILNLILQKDDQISIHQESVMEGSSGQNEAAELVDQRFFKDYVETGELQKKLTGRVSYLRSSVSVSLRYRGSYDLFQEIPVFKAEMSDFQKRILENVQDVGYKINSQQASLFVFPNETFGSQAADYYQKHKKEWSQYFNGRTNEAKLSQISRFSQKYANAIQQIISHPRDNIFCYISFIQGSGAIAFGMCLDQFGYERITAANKIRGKRKRYVILSDSLPPVEMYKIIEKFNDPKNKNGEYIQVLIGGKKVSEGVSFFNIKQIHILSPHWNFSLIDQAIARGVRAFSHIDSNTTVNIYLHASIREDEDTIDKLIYQKAIEKDKLIKFVQRLVQVNAIDCSLMYERNLIRDPLLNGSRECEYQECEYICSVDSKPFQMNTNTYDIYYIKEQEKLFSKLLNYIFKQLFQITILEIAQIIDKQGIKISMLVLATVLKNLIATNEPFMNQYGVECYLRQDKDVFFLVDRMYEMPNLFSAFYTEYPVIKDNASFPEIVESERMNDEIEQISKLPFILQKERIRKLPLDYRNAFKIIASKYNVENQLGIWIRDNF